MLSRVVHKLFASREHKTLHQIRAQIDQINALESFVSTLPDEAFPLKTSELKERFAQGESLDELLPEAFALAREACKRVLGMRPYDVQLMGGIVLHRGMVAEMRTGEGKTLVAVMPAYLNSLSGWSVHIVTVNDYLAQRDSHEMGPVFAFLGQTVGCVIPGMNDPDRRFGYGRDVTYVTNAEVGFDYLRDNMKTSRDEMVHRPLWYAIVDEVDSILIDEARTPLIMTTVGPDTSIPAYLANQAVSRLSESDFEVDKRLRTVSLTDNGLTKLEASLTEFGAISHGGLYDIHNSELVSFVSAALKARCLFHRDDDYIVRDWKVHIVDHHTGRVLEGRRYSDGIHQAIEAREGVLILPDNVTSASVTYQNFFRMYEKLSGMSGTAKTESDEFADIYGLDVMTIPTNRKVLRVDHEDEIYLTSDERDQAVVRIVAEARKRQQPVLVGTSSVERSEILSELFDKSNIPHAVLNARQNAQEAAIIAQAGRPGVVTIATNMAGRGTDIKLGGDVELLFKELINSTPNSDEPEIREALRDLVESRVREDREVVNQAGGLLVLGTERHESRRVDNQLRGRSGRQGDPGASRFLISLEDPLIRRFGNDNTGSMLRKLGLKHGEAISHPWVSASVRKAQEKVEAMHFETRKNVLKYDDVTNRQRLVFYAQRLHIIDGGDVYGMFAKMRTDAIRQMLVQAMPPNSYPEQWDATGLTEAIEKLFGQRMPIADWMAENGVDLEVMLTRIEIAIHEKEQKLESIIGHEVFNQALGHILLSNLDICWQEHLHELDILREGIHLRAFGQRNPLYEWHSEAEKLFSGLFDKAATMTIAAMSRMTIQAPAVEFETFAAPIGGGEVVVSEDSWTEAA